MHHICLKLVIIYLVVIIFLPSLNKSEWAPIFTLYLLYANVLFFLGAAGLPCFVRFLCPAVVIFFSFWSLWHSHFSLLDSAFLPFGPKQKKPSSIGFLSFSSSCVLSHFPLWFVPFNMSCDNASSSGDRQKTIATALFPGPLYPLMFHSAPGFLPLQIRLPLFFLSSHEIPFLFRRFTRRPCSGHGFPLCSFITIHCSAPTIHIMGILDQE